MNTIALYIPIIVLFVLILIPFIIARKKSQRSSYTIVCPKCKSETTGKFWLSFLGLKSKCQHCEKTIELPLTWGMRIPYLIVFVLVAGSFIGEFNIFALLFIVLILIVFFKDVKAVLTQKYANPIKIVIPKVNEPGTKLNATKWLEKGKRSLRSGNYQEAINSFSNTIRSEPRNALAYYQRGAAHHKLGNKEQALNDLKDAAKLGHKKSREFLKSKGVDW